MNLNLPRLPVESPVLMSKQCPPPSQLLLHLEGMSPAETEVPEESVWGGAGGSRHGCHGPWTSGDPSACVRAASMRVVGVAPPGPLLLIAWLTCPSLKGAETG